MIPEATSPWIRRAAGAAAFAASLAAFAASLAAHAQPSEVTRLDVAAYKNAVSMDCRAQGRRLKHSVQQIERRCRCVVDTLNRRMTDEEWRRATQFAKQGDGKGEAQALARHSAALKACRE